MTLYVDIGSSRIKLATGNGSFSDTVAFNYELKTLAEKLSSTLENYTKPRRVLVANVAGQAVSEVFQNYCVDTWALTPEFLTVKPEWGGIDNAYMDPQQLGVDRWLAIIAAWNLYKTDICVIDCGTAITLDFVTRSGQHLGGYIIPGPDSMNDILSSHTTLKSYDSASARSLTPGKSTEECVLNGAMLAVKAFIEQAINRLSEEQGHTFDCIMTGGASGKIGDLLDIGIHYEHNLLFTGMKLVAGE